MPASGKPFLSARLPEAGSRPVWRNSVQTHISYRGSQRPSLYLSPSPFLASCKLILSAAGNTVCVLMDYRSAGYRSVAYRSSGVYGIGAASCSWATNLCGRFLC